MALRYKMILLIFSPAVVLVLIGYKLGTGIKVGQNNPPPTVTLKMPSPPSINPADIVSLLPPDSILAIDDPVFESAGMADESLEPDERVIGVLINGEARAYPIPILSSHEVVNDVVGGEQVAITWCPLCYTALVFSRHIREQNQILTFGVSGKLLYNTLVMFDRQTNSLWSQLYGVAVDGPLDGTSLTIFPSLHIEWKLWKSQHPETLVLSKRLTCQQFNCGTYADNPRGSYTVDPYASYYNTPLEGVIDHQIPREDITLTAKERVLGVRLAGEARAYPFSELASQTVINDVLGGLPILVWFDGVSQTGVAYSRQVDNKTLSFFADSEDTMILIDDKTGSQWNATTGIAIRGPHRGLKLKEIFVTPAFSFGWFDYFPNSDTYRITP